VSTMSTMRTTSATRAVAVLGAGAGGLSSVVDLTRAGHEVRLWNRNPATLAPYGGRVVPHLGVLGEGTVRPSVVTTDLAAATHGADVLVVCLPALAHGAVFADLAEASATVPVVLSPGHTGGALHLRNVFGARGRPLPPVAELSTLPYIARKEGDGTVHVTGKALQVRCGALPGGEEALEAATGLFPAAVEVPDVLASSLSNVNLVLHPPGAVLAAAWVEATGGDFTFYVEAMTPGVARVVEALDAERLAVAARFGHALPPLIEEMALIGSAPVDQAVAGQTAAAIRAGEANRTIKAPASLEHRYYREDFPFALLPFVALAAVAGVETPLARALLEVAGTLAGPDLLAGGLDAAALGVAGLGAEELLSLVQGRP
jgi:opine dehydrogenase